MPFDADKFLEALRAIDLTPEPVAQKEGTNAFAQYFANSSYGIADASDKMLLAQAKEARKESARKKSVLSSVFDFLMTPAHYVMNSAMNVTDTVQGDKGFGEFLGDQAKIGMGAAGALTAPMREAVMIPGIEAPGEHAIDEFVQKHSHEYEGTGAATGSRLLEEFGWEPDSTLGKIGKAVTGFGLDVATDPLTYVGVGLLTKGKGAKNAIEEAAATGGDAAPFVKPVSQSTQAIQESVQQTAKPSVADSVLGNLGVNKAPDTNPAPVFPTSPLERESFKDLLQSPLSPEAGRSAAAARASHARWGEPQDYAPGNPNVGFDLSAAGAAKRSDSVLMNYKGNKVVNPVAVRQAIDNIVDSGYDVTKKLHLPEATGVAAKMAQDAADEYVKIIKQSAKDAAEKKAATKGKSAKAPVVRKLEMNPANQANLYKRLVEKATQQLEAAGRTGGLALPRNQKWIRQSALGMLKVAEKQMRVQHGLQPLDWNGHGLSLSSVIEHLGDDAFLDEHVTTLLKAFQSKNADAIQDPRLKQAFDNAVAERSVKAGAIAQSIMFDHVRLAEKVKESYSPASYLRWSKDEAVRKARFEASLAGMSSKESERVVDLIKQHVNVQGMEHLEPYQILNNIPTSTLVHISKHGMDHKTLEKLNKSFVKVLDETPRSLSKDITGVKAADFFLTRLSTWSGRPHDLKRLHQQGLMALESSAKLRAAWFADKIKNHSQDEINAAWMLATKGWANQALDDNVIDVSDKVKVLSAKFRDYLDNIVGPHSSVAKTSDLAGTPVMRSGMIMADLDKQLTALGSTFKFNKWVKAKQTIEGLPANYQGENWIFALENVDPKVIRQNPMHLLYDLDLAMERVMTEYAVIDDFVTRFGRRAGDGDFDPLIYRANMDGAHHRIPGDLRFPTEVADGMRRLLHDMEQGPWIPKNKAMREFMKRTGQWKRGVTIYNPSHHVRNLVGDAWLMWMAGINDPNVFKWSKEILHSERTRYREILTDPTMDRLRGMLNKTEFETLTTPRTKVILNKGGANLNAYEIYAAAQQRGLLLSADAIEDIITGSTGKQGLLQTNATDKAHTGLAGIANQPLGGKGHKAATKTSEYREHYVRMAHFTGYINKRLTRDIGRQLSKTANQAERNKIMDKLYEDAAQAVRKNHPDGRDLTQYEQKLRLAVPFYSWQRKSVPLIMEGMMKNPAKVTLYPKGLYAVQQSLGIESDGPADTFPHNQLYPDFLREAAMGPIGDASSDNPVAAFFGKLGRNYINPISGQEEGYTIVNPGNPLNDVVSKQIGFGSRKDIAGGIMGMLTPAINIPLTVATGEQPGIGIPIAEEEGGDGWKPWALNQVPILSQGQNIAEYEVERPELAEQGLDLQALMNLITGAGVKGTGQYYKSSEFDQKDFLKWLKDGNR